jgi:hypothetical protein
MSPSRTKLLERAAKLYQSGQTLQAGEIIFEDVPVEARPAWAARILRLALVKSGLEFAARYSQVLHDADNPRLWADGHRAFDTLRRRVLELERCGESGPLTGEQRLEAHLLGLAELVAKVTYNAANPDGPFDEDSGWWITRDLKSLIDDMWPEDQAFAAAAWSALCWRPDGPESL